MSRTTKKELLGKLRGVSLLMRVKLEKEVKLNPRARKYPYSHPFLRLEPYGKGYKLFLVERSSAHNVLSEERSIGEMYAFLEGMEKYHFTKDLLKWLR